MKRIIDVFVSVFFLIVFFPIIISLIFLVFIDVGRPIFFKQARPGKDGSPFYMTKFRTMKDQNASNGKLLPDAERITWFGGLLRRSSLDELPEFWNVLKGDMSLVGPRPLLMQYLPLYSKEQYRRHEVKPGITGWAQVNGRNAISWDEKFKLDVWYVDNQSFWLDVKILLLTVKKVVFKEGISADGHVTMPVFTGVDEGLNYKDTETQRKD